MRLHRRAKAAVRQRLRGRVVLGVMLRVPAGRGPALWRRFADRARLAAADQLLLQAGDFESAQEAVRPLLDSSRVKSRAWGIVATARENQGDPHGALDAARLATGTEQVRVAELLLHRRAAALAGEDAEADAMLRRLSETAPKTAKDFEVTVAAISDARPDLLAEYERSLSGWGAQFDPERFREVEAELQLAALYESDRQAALRDFQRIEAERVRFGRVIVRALARCRAWDDLAAFAKQRFLDRGDGRPPAGDINDPAVDPEVVAWHHLPIAQVRNAAYKAFGAGHISAAVTLAKLVLAARPEDLVAPADPPQRFRSARRGGGGVEARGGRANPVFVASDGGAVCSLPVGTYPVGGIRHPDPWASGRASQEGLGHSSRHQARVPV